MEITVVLVTCDRMQQMCVAVESLLAQRIEPRWNYELVVVDDGSSDGTYAVLQDLAAKAPVPMRILRTAGVGVPAARNLGARAASGRWMACFDDDQIASPGWLQALQRAAEETGGRCVGGALALRLPPEQAQSDLLPRTRALLGEHLLSTRLSRYPRRWLPASNNVLIELELFFATGGFDESFLQGGSDTDLFLRVKKMGERIWFAPEARAQHVISPQRLRREYLRWTSLKVGAASARILTKRRGWMSLAMAVAVRCGTSLLRDLPLLCLAKLAAKPWLALEARCSLWYTEGLLRGLTANYAPQMFGGERFLDALDFRRHAGERAGATRPQADAV